MACVPSEDSDQPGHPPRLIRVFDVRMKKAWVLSYPLSARRRLCSDWADAQADLSLRWAHSHFVGFVMRRLISTLLNKANTAYTFVFFYLIGDPILFLLYRDKHFNQKNISNIMTFGILNKMDIYLLN